METLLIVLAALAVSAVALVLSVLSGWLPRLAGRALYVVECLTGANSQKSKLSARDRAELVARLWVPW